MFFKTVLLLDVLVEKVLAQNIVIFPKGLIICILKIVSNTSFCRGGDVFLSSSQNIKCGSANAGRIYEQYHI